MAAVHRLDAARGFRLDSKGAKGVRYNFIGDEGIPLQEIAEVIGGSLTLPVSSVAGEEAAKHFECMGRFVSFDSRQRHSIPVSNWVGSHRLTG